MEFLISDDALNTTARLGSGFFFERFSRSRLKTWLLAYYGVIELDLDRRGGADAIRRALELLAAGKPLLMFPEGARSTTGVLQPFQAGIGLMTSDLSIGWDGEFKGQGMNSGVFVYYMEYDCNGQSKIRKGNITLIR